MIKICPRCQVRFSCDNNTSDYVHACCSGDNTLDYEDKKVIGNWEDSTGSGIVAKSFIMVAGLGNELQGTEAQVRDKTAYFGGVTDRGNPSQTTRQKKHDEYIEVKNE